MKSIYTALYLEQVDLKLHNLMEYDFIIDEFASMYMYADRSDLAQLNKEFENNKLNVIKEIPEEECIYTHIVQDSNGYFFAVIIKDGDWVDSLLSGSKSK